MRDSPSGGGCSSMSSHGMCSGERISPRSGSTAFTTRRPERRSAADPSSSKAGSADAPSRSSATRPTGDLTLRTSAASSFASAGSAPTSAPKRSSCCGRGSSISWPSRRHPGRTCRSCGAFPLCGCLTEPGHVWEHFELRIGPGGHPALKQKAVRRALAYGIDRVAIARALYGAIDARYPPSDSAVFSSASFHYRPNWRSYRYRPAEAGGCSSGPGAARAPTASTTAPASGCRFAS